jgi:hypothetical protein
MTAIKFLIDNDVVIKLAQMDAYADALAAISVNPNSVGSLGVMLRYMGLEGEQLRLKRTRTQAEADRLYKVLRTITAVEPTLEEQTLAALLMKAIIEAQLDMDEGEVALIAITLKRSETEMATGDKRAIRALPALEVLCAELAKLRGRLICFEQLIKHLCQKQGLPRIRNAVLAARHADQTITMAYDHLEPQGAGRFLKGMDLVIQDRITSVAPGWLKPM